MRRALGARQSAIRGPRPRARLRRIPVIYVNDNLGPWRGDARALLKHCTEEHRPGATLVRSLAPQESDYIVLKPRHSAFFGTPLAALLDELKIDTLVLAGISAESCVWMTACDAHTHGFRLIVPTHSIAGASARARRAMLENLRTVLNAKTPSSGTRIRLGTA